MKTKPPAQQREIREVPFAWKTGLVDDAEDPDYHKFSGYASTFGNTDWYGDTVMPGAFKESLNDHMPALCYQHNITDPVGVIDDAYEDGNGLFIKGRLPKQMDLVKGTLMPLIKCKALNSFSIGFNTQDSDAKEGGGRTLKKIDLWETSFVTIPADKHAKLLSVKTIEHLQKSIKTRRDVEQLLRESGLLSKDAAVWLASHFNLPGSESPSGEELAEATKSFSNFNTELQQLVRSLKP